MLLRARFDNVFVSGMCKKEENFCVAGHWCCLWFWVDGVW